MPIMNAQMRGMLKNEKRDEADREEVSRGIAYEGRTER
jgi:hypothetical protein